MGNRPQGYPLTGSPHHLLLHRLVRLLFRSGPSAPHSRHHPPGQSRLGLLAPSSPPNQDQAENAGKCPHPPWLSSRPRPQKIIGRFRVGEGRPHPRLGLPCRRSLRAHFPGAGHRALQPFRSQPAPKAAVRYRRATSDPRANADMRRSFASDQRPGVPYPLRSITATAGTPTPPRSAAVPLRGWRSCGHPFHSLRSSTPGLRPVRYARGRSTAWPARRSKP